MEDVSLLRMIQTRLFNASFHSHVTVIFYHVWLKKHIQIQLGVFLVVRGGRLFEESWRGGGWMADGWTRTPRDPGPSG